MEAPVSVFLFGTVAVHTEAGVQPVAGAKLQALLALLALAVPDPVSDDRLLEELWGDEQPGNPANALQAQVSQLRRLLGRDRVVRRGPGYALEVEPDAVDALRIERLVQAGREAAAAGRSRDAIDQLTEATTLGRGEALVGLVDHHFAQEASTRLASLLLAAHEERIDAELASGRHADVVDGLSLLVTEHPLRERFHGQRILALYRCGRQAEALRAYQQARDVLAEELGLDPGPELQALERAVLTQDPALASPVPLAPAAPVVAMPVPLTSFVGRSAELERIDAARSRARLVTLVGPGGVGKTRLVLEAAGRLGPGAEVWYVELARVTAAVALPEAVASVLGARDDSTGGEPGQRRSPVDRVIERLGSRPAVVVLDNCEHLAEAAAEVAVALLTGCPGLTILATSREPLAVPGEVQVLVEPLGVDEAVQLFTERATAVQPLFGADGEDDALAELCRRLDGLPLAIELAAARAKTLPVPELVARLDQRFELLRSSERGDPGRRSGLGAAIDSSYDLLFDEERYAFRMLSVFAGGITVDAAADLLGPDALDVLARLVDRSLLMADTSGAESRFRMLESLRAYGRERLVEVDELTTAAAAHSRWAIGLAEAVNEHAVGPDQLAWLDRLDAEHDNLRAALATTTVDDPRAAVQLMGALLLPWWFRGRRQEARHWAEAALAARDGADPIHLARLLAYTGLIAETGGWTGAPGGLEEQLELAERRQREAMALSEAVGDDEGAASARALVVVTMARKVGVGTAVDLDATRALTAEAVPVFERTGNHYAAASVNIALATAAVAAGDLDLVATATEAAEPHARRSGDRFTASRVAWLRGQLADAAGDPMGAYRHVEQSLRLVDELGMSQTVTGMARYLVRYAAKAGDPELADQWQTFVDGRAPAWTYYDLTATAAAHNRDGLAHRAAGRLDEARAAHLEAQRIYAEAGAAAGAAFTESCLGFLAGEAGAREAAAQHHRAALEAAILAGEAPRLALALEGLASTVVERDGVTAAELLGAAHAQWEGSGQAAGASHRSDVAATRERLRARLGDDAEAGAREAGEHLDRPRLLALARRVA